MEDNNMIYVNGKRTNLNNIFDYKKGYENFGRTYSDILNDWINYHSTYYFVDSVPVYFMLVQ